MKRSVASRVWLVWYATLIVIALVFTAFNMFIHFHHPFIVTGPRLVIWAWFLGWLILLPIGVAKFLKHLRMAVRSN